MSENIPRSCRTGLIRFPCEQYTKGLRSESKIFVKNPICQDSTNLSEFIVRQVLCRSGLYLKPRDKCKDFIARDEDDGISKAIVSPFFCTNTNIIVRQFKSIEDREIGKQFALVWRELAR